MQVHRQVGRKQADRHMGGRTDRQTDIHIRARAETDYRQQTDTQAADRHKDSMADRQAGSRQTYRLAEGQTDRPRDRQQTD